MSDYIEEAISLFDEIKRKREQDPEWKTNNLEYDLRTTDWIIDKVQGNDVYAQNLYAALCNNQFLKNDVFPILKEEYWTASWRYAGGLIADILGEGDYMDWYCTGSGGPMGDMGADGYLPEGVVADIIRDDLFKLGWLIVPYSD